MIFSLAFVVSSGSLVWAAQNSLEAQVGNKKSKFAMISLLSTQSSFHSSSSDVNAVAASFLTLVPSLALSKNFNISAIGGVTVRYTSPEDVTMNNTLIRLSRRSYKINDDWRWVPIVGVVAPTNEVDRIENSFITAIRLEPTLLGKVSLLGLDLDLVLTTRLTKSFHEFDRTANLTAGNNEYLASQFMLASYSVTDKFFVDFDFLYGGAWTYQQAFVSRFSLGQSINYLWNKKTIISLGHSSSGNALDATGGNTNVRFFDKNRSVGYFRLRWAL